MFFIPNKSVTYHVSVTVARSMIASTMLYLSTFSANISVFILYALFSYRLCYEDYKEIKHRFPHINSLKFSYVLLITLCSSINITITDIASNIDSYETNVVYCIIVGLWISMLVCLLLFFVHDIIKQSSSNESIDRIAISKS